MGINFGPLDNNRLLNWTRQPPPPPNKAPAPPPKPELLAPSGITPTPASFNRPNTLAQQAHAMVVGSFTRLAAYVAPTQPAGGAGVSYWSAYSKQVLDLVNATRSYYGLAPLEEKFGLSYLASNRSNDMAYYQYFSHTDLYGRSPEDRFRADGISFRYGGENIAYGQTTPYQVVQDWMNSPGHRANILDPNYKYLGVGVGQDKYGRLFWSQEFSG